MSRIFIRLPYILLRIPTLSSLLASSQVPAETTPDTLRYRLWECHSRKLD